MGPSNLKVPILQLLIPTYSGLRLNLADPREDQISLIDIAHSLAKMPRYLGHSIRPLSVAEHSVRLALTVSMDNQIEALLHDGAEAYMADVPASYKASAMMGTYSQTETLVQNAVYRRFGVKFRTPEVKLHDQAIRLCEWDSGLFKVPESLIGYSKKTPDQIRLAKTLERAMNCHPICDRWGWHWNEALEQFLRMARRLGLE